MQTTLLGLAIAFIIALVAALIGPYFIDWNQFRPQFETEATRVIGAPVHVGGELDARLLPTPSLRLRSVVVAGAFMECAACSAHAPPRRVQSHCRRAFAAKRHGRD